MKLVIVLLLLLTSCSMQINRVPSEPRRKKMTASDIRWSNVGGFVGASAGFYLNKHGINRKP